MRLVLRLSREALVLELRGRRGEGMVCALGRDGTLANTAEFRLL